MLVRKVKQEFLTKQLPQTRRDYIIERFGLSHEHAFIFVANNLDTLLIEIEKLLGEEKRDEISFINNILLHDYLALVNQNIELDKIDVRRRCEKIISFADVLKKKVINHRVKSEVFGKLFAEVNLDKSALDLVRDLNLFLIEDDKIVNTSIEKLFEQNPSAIVDYKNKEKKRLKIFDFFVGRVHKDLHERADPDLVDRLVIKRLKSLLD